MSYDSIINTVAEDLELPKEVVLKTYKAYWKFIREHIEKLPLKDNLSQKDFESLKTSINIPSLGKINCTYSRYVGIKNRFNIINKLQSR